MREGERQDASPSRTAEEPQDVRIPAKTGVPVLHHPFDIANRPFEFQFVVVA
jgi:hypothetical protein